MRLTLAAIAVALLLASCKKTMPAPTEKTPAPDSTAVPADSTAADTAQVPQAADGLFDDFVYSFMRKPKFQTERIAFPLPYIKDGVNTPVERQQWKFDRLYVGKDVYTMIFDNAKSVAAEKDTSLNHVVVEWVYLTKRRVKQYVFDKPQGKWMLTRIEEHAMSQNVNSDFYEFYARFSTDKRFQGKHIENPFHFKTYDYDNYQNVEGLLDVEQWPDYRPALPKGTITNINYGQSYGNARQRVLMICSQSGGMGCSLTFVRKGKTWMLKSLEN